MLFPLSVELSNGISSFTSQCVVLQQLCFEWKPLILRKTQIRNDLILLLMDWLDCINTGITLTHKVLLPCCHHWVCHLSFASLIREMGSIDLSAEIVYHSLNCSQRFSENSLEPMAVLDGLFLKIESIHVMFIGKFKLPEYVSLSYIFQGFVIPCRFSKLFTSLWPRR